MPISASRVLRNVKPSISCLYRPERASSCSMMTDRLRSSPPPLRPIKSPSSSVPLRPSTLVLPLELASVSPPRDDDPLDQDLPPAEGFLLLPAAPAAPAVERDDALCCCCCPAPATTGECPGEVLHPPSPPPSSGAVNPASKSSIDDLSLKPCCCDWLWLGVLCRLDDARCFGRSW